MKTILAALVLLSAPLVMRAAEDGTVSLSPAVIMLAGDAGQSTTQTLTLRNGTSRAFSFQLEAKDVVTREGKRLFLDAGSIAGSIAATAVFSPRQLNVPAGKSATVRVTVTLPSNAAHRAVVVLLRGTNRIMSGNVPATFSLGTLMTFRLSDRIELAADPLSVRTQSPAANLAVTERCTNSGSEPLVAKGMLAILGGDGSLVGRAMLQAHRFLPGESADLGAEYADELKPGHYRVVVTYDVEGQSLSRSAEVDVR